MLIPANFTCDACGEEIDVVVDSESGRDQEYVEDCPVCCRPHRLRVRLDGDEAEVDAEIT